MKKPLYSLLVAALFSLGSLCAHGAEAAAQAIILKVQGTVQSVAEGQAPVALKVGDKLPQGATIQTGADSLVAVQAFNGAVALITANSKVNLEKLSVTASGGVVTKQTALLNLKVGGIISYIDPANHDINDYAIRTPQGVAAARGTVFIVGVNSSGFAMLIVKDSAVTFTNSAGQSVTVHPGETVTVNPSTGEISVPRLTTPGDEILYTQTRIVDELMRSMSQFTHQPSTNRTATIDATTTPTATGIPGIDVSIPNTTDEQSQSN